MKTPIGVALICCGTLLMMFPFFYYLCFLSNEAYVIAHLEGATVRPEGFVYERFGWRSGLVGLMGFVMVLMGILGTRRKTGARQQIDVSGSLFLDQDES